MSSKIHVNKPLSSRLIIELLDDNPDLEEIECPQSLYERTSETYIDALNELGIQISIIEHRGRPQKYDENLKEEINKMIDSGLTPKNIANRLNINRKTVYYLKNKKLKQGPKSKYSKELKEEIVDLKNKGTSVKIISSMLNIPVRTIYYILQKERELINKEKNEGVY
ncbi:helix-turn-helix domain-containing protein [Methanosphaera sp. WGK6]|uniref:helix-turn-helix domain-containing protein n=1 Tax=Methanosphaera sp. WGK6 TaxID=1561964 RepID=UPI00084CB07D|nr:helix-turn-helix domain-containing protein [Methanosphaera sp. WGK6]OED30863.1 resolvase [Methanosphaera sp. WGK6]